MIAGLHPGRGYSAAVNFIDQIAVEPGTYVFQHAVVPMGLVLAREAGDVQHTHRHA